MVQPHAFPTPADAKRDRPHRSTRRPRVRAVESALGNALYERSGAFVQDRLPLIGVSATCGSLDRGGDGEVALISGDDARIDVRPAGDGGGIAESLRHLLH